MSTKKIVVSILSLLVALGGMFYVTSNTPMQRSIDSYLLDNHFQGSVLIAKKDKVLFKKATALQMLNTISPIAPKPSFASVPSQNYLLQLPFLRCKKWDN